MKDKLDCDKLTLVVTNNILCLINYIVRLGEGCYKVLRPIFFRNVAQSLIVFPIVPNIYKHSPTYLNLQFMQATVIQYKMYNGFIPFLIFLIKYTNPLDPIDVQN